MKTKHYHAINGTSGCMPDSNVLCSTKQDAIDWLLELFDKPYGMATNLRKYQYYGGSNLEGADYAEILECNDSECFDENGNPMD